MKKLNKNLNWAQPFRKRLIKNSGRKAHLEKKNNKFKMLGKLPGNFNKIPNLAGFTVLAGILIVLLVSCTVSVYSGVGAPSIFVEKPAENGRIIENIYTINFSYVNVTTLLSNIYYRNTTEGVKESLIIENLSLGSSIDDMEDIIDWGAWDSQYGINASVSISTEQVKQGTYSEKITFNGSGWGSVAYSTKTLSSCQDWSKYNKIHFWLYGNNSNAKYEIILFNSSGWPNYPFLGNTSINWTGWRLVEFNKSDSDWSEICSIQQKIHRYNAPETEWKTIHIDDLKLFSQNGSTTYLWNLTNVIDGNYYIDVEIGEYLDSSKQFKVRHNKAPNVSLEYPTNNAVLNSSAITFNFNVADDNNQTDTCHLIINDKKNLSKGAYSVSGWTRHYDPNSPRIFKENYKVFTEVSPAWYKAKADGSLELGPGADDLDFISFAHSHNILVLPLFGNAFNASLVHTILSNNTTRTAHINNITNKITSIGADGADIDYENINQTDKDNFTLFIQDLARDLHNNSKLLYVTLQPKKPYFDYEKLCEAADKCRIMAYDEHWATSPTPGPVASYNWTEDVINYSLSKIDKDKLILGVPTYGYDWAVNESGHVIGSGEDISYNEAIDRMSQYNAKRNFSNTTRVPYFNYTKNATNTSRVVYYSDNESLSHKLQLVEKYNLSGIVMWRVGLEDGKIWPTLFDWRLKKGAEFLNGTQNFTLTLPDGQYNWSINCTDMSDSEGASETRRFFIDADNYDCDLNHDGITINDWSELMTAYKCFLGIKNNCNKINFRDWNSMKEEYKCFTGTV